MKLVGKIDREKFKAVSKHITTDEVVITDERIAHIEQRHPGAYERFSPYIQEVLESPDYVLEASRPKTAVLLKDIVVDGQKIKLILRLVAHNDPDGYKNSVLSLWKIDEKEWQRLLRSKKVLYKSE
ncbi:MAG: hypothetical protein LBN05_05975 [Oscillospiraceae bacterium]|nr:hypothetical protein [Oscillospiraceae bacterium]